MPRPETDIAATRTRIMDAAEHIIQERGSISFTMTDLATAVGMSPSNLYRFFESKGYVDLADHYMAMILAEAMEKGYFKGLELDSLVSLVNTMMQPFCNPMLMMGMMHLATETRLRIVINTILNGLQAETTQPSSRQEMHIAR